MPTMVSQQPTCGSDVRMSEPPELSPRGTAGRNRKEMDSIYRAHPIPALPSTLITHPSRASRDSMLAYSERMRQISKVRADTMMRAGDRDAVDAACPQTILEIQARHIPRKSQQKQENAKPQQRRPLSLDELIGQRGKNEAAAANENKRSDRCMSEPPPPPHIVIPSLAFSSSPRPEKTSRENEEQQVRINFVSTADLFDLVDFNMRSKKVEHIQLDRVDNTLQLINEANFFRSLSSRRKIKQLGADRESDVNTASLVVHGTSSPKEASRGNGDKASDYLKNGDWAWVRKEMTSQANPYDSDVEEDEVDDDDKDNNDYVDLDLDLIQDQRNMLMVPQKLHFRPNWAKRMRLHRSQLSAIPEDEHSHRAGLQPAAAPPLDFHMLVPPIPTTSSLAAIKRTKPLELLMAPDAGMKKTLDRMDANHVQREDDFSPRSLPSNNKDKSSTRSVRLHNKHKQSPENRLPHEQLTDSPQQDKVKAEHSHGHSSKKETARRVVRDLNSLSTSLPGRSMLSEASDIHQKKIRKIVFLRDLPERPSSYRSSQ